MSDQLMSMATAVVDRVKELGAEEATATVSQGSHATIQRRGGQTEQANEAISRGLTVSLLCNDRYTSNSTSDLRPAALDAFLTRCVEASQFVEADEYRRLPDAELVGRGVSEEALDQDDPAWQTYTADDRDRFATAVEDALLERGGDDRITASSYVADGRSEMVRVMSNGFADQSRGAWFAAGGDMTLREGDKRPESGAYYAARHLADLPSAEFIADEILARVTERLGSRSIESGTYPMVLLNRCAGRLLGVLGGPLSGGSLHQGQSCLAEKLGSKIGSELFTIVDDPTVPRGLGSRPWDGDGLKAKARTIVERGVLQQYNIGVYYGRKLGMAPTSAGRSNWIVPAGTVPRSEVLASLPKAIGVTGFLGGNSNGTSGDFSFGIRGQLLEYGKPVQALSEMNVTGNITEIFQRLVAVGDDPWEWSSVRSPTLVFEGVQFSGA